MKKRKIDFVSLLAKLVFIICILALWFPIYESRISSKQEQIELLKHFDSTPKASQKDASSVDLSGSTMEVVGGLYIPSVDIELPVFPDLSEDALSTGVGMMPGYDNLNAQASTHAVMSSHNGLQATGLFTNLEKVKLEDHFYVKAKGRIMKYKVVEINVVLPTDASKIAPQKDRTLMTLITCTPFGINSHRLLVMGEYMEDVDTINEDVKFTISLYEYIVAGITGASIIGILISFKKGRKK